MPTPKQGLFGWFNNRLENVKSRYGRIVGWSIKRTDG